MGRINDKIRAFMSIQTIDFRVVLVDTRLRVSKSSWSKHVEYRDSLGLDL